MEMASRASDITKTVDVLDAISWLSNAWKAVSPDTIRKCFANAGFVQKNEELDPIDAGADHIHADLQNLLKAIQPDITAEEYVTIDDDLASDHTETAESEKQLIQSVTTDGVHVSTDE